MNLTEEQKVIVTTYFNAALYEMQKEEVEQSGKLKMDNDYILVANMYLEDVLEQPIETAVFNYSVLVRAIDLKQR